jgi:TolA-binding protein
MTNRVKTSKILLCFVICASSLTRFSQAARPPAPPPPPGGILQASENAAAQALDLLNSGKLPEAEDAYADLIAKYPTAGVVPEAIFRLGYVQYLEEKYDQSVQTLKRIVSPPATPEIKAAADLLVPQILAAEAGKMTPGSPDRKAAFENAIKQFDAFIQQYPKSMDVLSASYGRAMAAYQIADYDGAAKSLEDNLQHFPNSESIQDSEDLLAVVLTAQANSILRAKGDQQVAFAKFERAIGYLANVIQRRADVALSNDAQFQIGEVLYSRAAAEKDPQRTGDLTHAIDAYQAVQPNDALIALQQQRVAIVLARVRQMAMSNNAAALEQIQRIQDRENAKLQALKTAPDQTFNAQLRIASCYFQLQKYDESRVLLKYLQAFAEDPAQKKQIQYYLVMTYASQGVMDKAETAYNAFQAAYKGDPVGEALPLAMGTAYLTGSNPQPDKAAAYLQQERELYPNSPLVNDALNRQAAALVAEKKYDKALSTYNEFLATSPPSAQAAEAERGIAAIYQQTGKLAEAVAQYQKIADTFAGTPMAEQCAFYAAGLETTVDVKKALPMLQAFLTKFPNGKFTAQTLMMIGQMQAAQGNTDAATASYRQIIEKFPATDFGPQAYFQIASLLANEHKTDDMLATLKEFIGKYPDNKDIFYAYDTIGQTQVNKGQVKDAIATYSEMADKHSDNPNAATALYRTAELWRKSADALGKYPALNEAQRKDWSTDVSNSIAAAEKLIAQFPDSAPLGLSLKTLLADQELLLDAQLQKPEDIDKYFHGLAEKSAANPSAKSRILFTLATFTYAKNPVMGLAQMGVVYNPSLVYAPSELDLYGSALLDHDKADQAYQIYQKIARDYPIPANVGPRQAAPVIQEAQAIALFGMATALEKQGKTADAGKFFTELKTNFPWSPKVLEADFGIAKSFFAQNKFDDASKLLVGIVGSRSAPATVRAHAFLLIGQIQEAKGNIDAAIDSYLKTAAFYESVEDAAAEGLWRGGQMLEKQAAMLNEQSVPKKSEQIRKAVSAYKDIVTKYPDSPFIPKAQDRLNALGSP